MDKLKVRVTYIKSQVMDSIWRNFLWWKF